MACKCIISFNHYDDYMMEPLDQLWLEESLYILLFYVSYVLVLLGFGWRPGFEAIFGAQMELVFKQSGQTIWEIISMKEP